jgi:hypothetical protein
MDLGRCFLSDMTANLARVARDARVDPFIAFAPAGKRHWTGAGAVLRALHQVDPTIVDPFNPLPPRPRGMWLKKYERLERAVTVAQERSMRSLVGAANKSIAQQRHQVMHGRLIKQRKELRERTLELVAKQKEALSAMHSAMTAFRAGTPIPDPEFLTPEEERELNELLVRNGRMDDVKLRPIPGRHEGTD